MAASTAAISAAAQPAALQGLQAGDGRPAGTGHAVLQHAPDARRWPAPSRPRPSTVCAARAVATARGRPMRTPAVAQGLDDHVHEGRARAGQPGHRVQQLLLDLAGDAHRAEQLLHQLAVLRRGLRAEAIAAGPCAHQARRVGHHADQPAPPAPSCSARARQTHAGRDGNHQFLRPQPAAELGHHRRASAAA